MALLAQKHPSQLTNEAIQLALDGLQYLLDELRYERVPPGLNVAEHQIPELRADAGKLATALSAAGYANAPAIEMWLTEAAHDPLPEVRQAIEADATDN